MNLAVADGGIGHPFLPYSSIPLSCGSLITIVMNLAAINQVFIKFFQPDSGAEVFDLQVLYGDFMLVPVVNPILGIHRIIAGLCLTIQAKAVAINGDAGSPYNQTMADRAGAGTRHILPDGAIFRYRIAKFKDCCGAFATWLARNPRPRIGRIRHSGSQPGWPGIQGQG
jgi:hypothetical protein